jgi:hypothetical protein
VSGMVENARNELDMAKNGLKNHWVSHTTNLNKLTQEGIFCHCQGNILLTSKGIFCTVRWRGY